MYYGKKPEPLDVLHYVGSFGRFQRYYSVSIMGLIWFFCGAHTILMVFVSQEPPRYPVCSDKFDVLPRCDPRIPLAETDCSTPYAYLHPSVSIVSEFKTTPLLCSQNGFPAAAAAQSAFFAGFLVGVSLLGRLADVAGRWRAAAVAIYIMEISSILSAFSGSLVQFGILRACVGAGVGGSGLLTFLTLAEVTGEEHRHWLAAFHAGSFALGASSSCLLSVLLPSWRLLVLTVSTGGLVCLCVPFRRWSIESPRWLAAHGWGIRAMAVWQFIASVNGRPLPDEMTPERLAQDNLYEKSARVASRSGFQPLEVNPEVSGDETSLFQEKRTSCSLLQSWTQLPLRRWLPALISLWFACSLVYYGVYLNEEYLAKPSSQFAKDNGAVHIQIAASPTDPKEHLRNLGVNNGLDNETLGNVSQDALLSSIPILDFMKTSVAPDIEKGLKDESHAILHFENISASKAFDALHSNNAAHMTFLQDTVSQRRDSRNNHFQLKTHKASRRAQQEHDQAMAVSSSKVSTPDTLSQLGDKNKNVHLTLPKALPFNFSVLPVDHHNGQQSRPEEMTTLLPFDSTPIASYPFTQHLASAVIDAGQENRMQSHRTSTTTRVGDVKEQNVSLDEDPLKHYSLTAAASQEIENSHLPLHSQKKSEIFMTEVEDELGNGVSGVQHQLGQLSLGELWDFSSALWPWNQTQQRLFYNFNPEDLDATFWGKMRTVALTTCLAFLFELPMGIISVFLAGNRYCGRRGVIVLWSLLSGVLNLTGFFLVKLRPELALPLVSFLVNLARLFTSGSFLLLYVFSSELLPTTIRSTTIGLCSVAARIAGIAAPVIVKALQLASPGSQLLLLGCASIFAATWGALVLPETLGRTMVDSVYALTPQRRPGRKEGRRRIIGQCDRSEKISLRQAEKFES